MTRTATITKIKSAPQVGIYAPTSVDAAKRAADFLLVQVAPYVIRWNDARIETVTPANLRKLQSAYSWAADF